MLKAALTASTRSAWRAGSLASPRCSPTASTVFAASSGYGMRNFFSRGKKTIKVVFVKPGGEKVTVDAKIGDSMLEVAHANKIDVEGACGGETACSTCHIILKPEVYSKLPPASEAEEDMLDLATGLTKTSRLGCQVLAAPELDGMEITLPSTVTNRMS